MQAPTPEMLLEIEQLKTEDARLKAELARHESTLVVHAASITRLETVVNNINAHMEGLHKDVNTQLTNMNTRLDTALSSTLRALPPWAAVVGAIVMTAFGALLEHYGLH